jgi:LysM repeat protein
MSWSVRAFAARTLAVMLCAVLAAGVLAPGGAAAQSFRCGKTYRVEPGDTLYSIAEKCDVSYLVLQSINVEMSDPAKIYPGQIIRLEAEVPLEWWQEPASGPAQPGGLQVEEQAEFPASEYIVRKGDALARIAYLYGTTVTDLMALNPQLNGSAIIHPGDVLRMPPGARHQKGWVGVSTLLAEGGDRIEARAVDFPPYADLHFRLGLRDEFDDFDYQIIAVRSDARGEARATLTIPFYAWEDELWEVRVVNMNAGEDSRVVSPAIRIDY